MCGFGSSAAYVPNAFPKFAYGSPPGATTDAAAVMWSSSPSAYPLWSPDELASASPSPSAGIGGVGLLSTGVASLRDGSGGPGPGTFIADGSEGRATETRTCRESGFSAGLSASALPAALRMKVYTGRAFSGAVSVCTAGRTSGFLW